MTLGPPSVLLSSPASLPTANPFPAAPALNPLSASSLADSACPRVLVLTRLRAHHSLHHSSTFPQGLGEVKTHEATSSFTFFFFVCVCSSRVESKWPTFPSSPAAKFNKILLERVECCSFRNLQPRETVLNTDIIPAGVRLLNLMQPSRPGRHRRRAPHKRDAPGPKGHRQSWCALRDARQIASNNIKLTIESTIASLLATDNNGRQQSGRCNLRVS